jgi:hypothetical protein
MLFVIKGFLPLRAMECVWLQRLVLWLCYPTMSFPSKRIFIEEVIHALNKTFIELCNLHRQNAWQPPTLLICACWKGPMTLLRWLLNFFPNNLEPLKHIMMGLFEATICCHVCKTKAHPWEVHIHIIFLAYVNDKGSNLQTCVQVFKMVVCCPF